MADAPSLARRIGLFDAVLLIMGGIVGSGIFLNPYVVAREVGTPILILLAWGVGGLIALAGAFVYAELASLRPQVGGQYVFLREAFGPGTAFVYGWSLLLVMQSGGMAAVAVTFARYFAETTRLAVPEPLVAVVTLASLTVLNCLGVVVGTRVQSVLMITKTVAILGLVVAGLFFAKAQGGGGPLVDRPLSMGLVTAFGAALVPVLFAYGGWQTGGFLAGEMKDPDRDMPRALVLGVAGVVVLYLSVNYVCLRVLGAPGLAASTAPASDVVDAAFGRTGTTLLGLGITASTLGFLSQGLLTAPRVYYAMARDGVFFETVGFLHEKTRVPVVAIVLQGAWAAVIALSGRYEQIINYVVSADFIWFGLTGVSLFVLRRRGEKGGFAVPGHPWTTGFFVAGCWLVVAAVVASHPGDSLLGWGILLCGIPLYFVWRRR
jgi:APA family basic amino acid/polyamine antiporter